MTPTQFIREESFSNKGGKPGRNGVKRANGKAGASRRYSAAQVLAELNRVAANCKHVHAPQPPLYIAGSTKRVAKAKPRPKPRWDTRVVLGAVASWHQRWDECDPVVVADWVVQVRKYAETLWGHKVAAIVMHVDEAHPHVHIIVHDGGKSVKPFSPGFAAGDSAYDAALGAGVARIDANRIRHAEYKRAESVWLDHYHLHVGMHFGMARIGLHPRSRGPRVSALELRAQKEWNDPVDKIAAAANVRVIRKLLRMEIDRPLPGPGAGEIDVLSSIGFVPEHDYPALARRLREEGLADPAHPAAVALQSALLEILKGKPDWPEFVRLCKANEIDLIFRWNDSSPVGITFRQAGRAFPGFKLGSRFTWPVLSRSLPFDRANPAHVSLLLEMELRASTSGCVLEPLDPGPDEPKPARAWRRLPKLVPLIEQATSDGIAHCWSSGRVAIKEQQRSLIVVDTAPDVVSFAIAVARKRGWTSLTLSGRSSVLRYCVGPATAAATALGIDLVVARDGAPQHSGKIGARTSQRP